MSASPFVGLFGFSGFANAWSASMKCCLAVTITHIAVHLSNVSNGELDSAV